MNTEMAHSRRGFWAINSRTPLQGGLIFILLATGCEKKQPPPAPPAVVEVISATPTNIPIIQEWIGTLDGFVNAQIRAQVTGYLLTQNYREGSKVKKGDMLFEIDPRPFQAVVDQAEAKLAQDKAQVAKTELDVKRYTPLAKEQAISQETLDDAVQANLAADAQVKADEAAIETARLNLGFTRITSPVDGLAGVAQAQVGDLVSPGGNVLTTVSTVDPIKVYFQANEESYLKFWRQVDVTGDTNAGPPMELILSDGSVYPQKGRFFFADRQVNLTTGTLQIVGVFPNPDYMLRPGQYGLVRAQTGIQSNVFVLPQRAVMEMQDKYQIAVVGESNKVQVRNVKVGSQVGANWIVEDGLKSGERVVVEGTQKATDGAVVNPEPLGGQQTNGAQETNGAPTRAAN